MWKYILTLCLVLVYCSIDVEGVCQNIEADSVCDQRASNGECYFNVSMGCRCALACQSTSSCPNHPNDGDTDCLCKIAHILGKCGVNKTECLHTCYLRDAVICDDLEVVPGAAPSNINPLYLDIITYNCLPGYYVVNGSTGKRVCTENGTWFKHVVEGTAPYCGKISCGLSPAFENVTASQVNGVFDDVISYSCNMGYVQVGGSNGSMRCNETGSWDPDTVYGDPPSCEKIYCGLSPSFENVTASQWHGVFDDAISYTCKVGYEQVGGSNGSMRCNETGSWDPDPVYGHPPLCEKIACGLSPAFANATSSQVDGTFDDVISYFCNVGYEQVGGSNGSMRCNETGSWDPDMVYGDPPLCEKISCGLSPAFENVTASQIDGVFGDIISYSCNVGYVQVGGSNGSMRCSETGSWDKDVVYGDPPLCEKVSCGLSPSFENVTASQSYGSFDDVISYFCNVGYEQVGGSNGSLRCNETGSWDPDMVYGDPPLCEKISCGLSPAFENVTASHGNGVFDDVISYSCNVGYVHVGGSNGSMRCNETGSWYPDTVYGDPPLCQKISCGLSPAFENVTASQMDGAFGDVIYYFCNMGYVQVGSSNGSMRCNETGSWDPDPVYGHPPLCQKLPVTSVLSASSVTVVHNVVPTVTSTTTSVDSGYFIGASSVEVTDHSSGSITTSFKPTPFTATQLGYTSPLPPLSKMVTSSSTTVTKITSTLDVPLSTSYHINDASVLFVRCFHVNVTRSSEVYTKNIPITKKFAPEPKEAKGGEALGAVAIIILVSSMLCIVIIDLMSIQRYCNTLKSNLREVKIRCREVTGDDVVHVEDTSRKGTMAANDNVKVFEISRT
ncbi:sushi, von Willebrand factor type A, EGF and pentraxin domain-containing protein 1-like [Haliotis asinina]|uniref:sushi, von Willebrand factor type A, EGF and pentraxin domain-containing protein 1-like n=1 Tax=Haliotis asinina TaxID=109174 RepID=UPI0035325BB1